MAVLFLLVSFLASTAGAICGIGGGVVIKPVLDLTQMGDASTINFLSGCTVLSMSLYSVCMSLRSSDSEVDISTGIPLALGAAIGGIIGKELFSSIKAYFGGSSMVGGVQAVVLGIVTIATLMYTLNKTHITTRNISGGLTSVLIGLLLGIMSSFLGIGGGPMNLVVLGYCFSMDSKTAAGNSLYIILFSQAASLLTSIATGGVPYFRQDALLLMIAGGIGGGIAGRKLNKRMDNRAVDKLFVALLVLIVIICMFNAVRAFH